MPVDEVMRRKRKRQRARTRNIAVGIAVVIVAAGVLGWMGYRSYQEHQRFSGMYHQIIDEVAAADAYLVEIDDVMDDPLGSATTEERSVLRKKAVAVTSAADHAINESDGLSGEAKADADKVAVAQLLEGAKGRKAMVSLAMEAFDVVDSASSMKESASATWDLVIDTDIAARDAVSDANRAITADALGETTTVLQQCRDQFGASLAQLRGMESAKEGLDFSLQEDYLEKRIEALEYAIATNEALSLGDRQAAAEQNGYYDEADKESAELARGLPQSIGAVVESAYVSDVCAIQARYDKERERVASADSLVRSYLRA